MRKFIDDNKISFAEGNRNLSVITCIGYAQHKGLSKDDLREDLAYEIAADKFIGEEIDRLWNWAASKNYKNFWNTTRAMDEYTF